LSDTVKIFYADDDSDDRFLFRAALQELGVAFQLEEFENGVALEDALAKENNHSDLIFLDLNMPQKNGLETLASLKDVIPEKKLKIIVFTTAGNEEVIKETFQLNAVLFVKKPSDFHELMATLGFILNHAGQYKLPVVFEDFTFRLSV
jgi:CheY-like chemotaxis protein